MKTRQDKINYIIQDHKAYLKYHLENIDLFFEEEFKRDTDNYSKKINALDSKTIDSLYTDVLESELRGKEY